MHDRRHRQRLVGAGRMSGLEKASQDGFGRPSYYRSLPTQGAAFQAGAA